MDALEPKQQQKHVTPNTFNGCIMSEHFNNMTLHSPLHPQHPHTHTHTHFVQMLKDPLGFLDKDLVKMPLSLLCLQIDIVDVGTLH